MGPVYKILYNFFNCHFLQFIVKSTYDGEIRRASISLCRITVSADLKFFATASAFSALTLLAGWQEGHPACKKAEWWGAGVVIYLERGADLHMAQLMPLPLTVSCFSKIQIGFTFLVPAHPGSPRKRAVKRVSVCVCVCKCKEEDMRVAERPCCRNLRCRSGRSASRSGRRSPAWTVDMTDEQWNQSAL